MFKQYLSAISNNPLFSNIERADLNNLLSCIQSYVKHIPARGYIFLAGGKSEGIGILLRGKARVVKEDIFGNRMIISDVVPGEIFGEILACAGIDEMPTSVEAETECDVLIMNYQKIITTCSSSCEFHNMLIKNMLQILAQKNLYLTRKNDILSSRTTRERIMNFLKSIADEKGSLSFDIPYNRQELADFLSVNRSAMTRELIKMKEAGLIDFHKNQFTLF